LSADFSEEHYSVQITTTHTSKIVSDFAHFLAYFPSRGIYYNKHKTCQSKNDQKFILSIKKEATT